MEIDALIEAAAFPGIARMTVLQFARRAFELAQACGDSPRSVRALLVEADSHFFGAGDDAAVIAETVALAAQNKAAEIGDKRLEGAALARRVRAASMRGDRAAAFAHGERQLALARFLQENEGNSNPLADALNSVAGLFLNTGNYLAAEPLLTEALHWARANRRNVLETIVLSNIALIKAASGQHREAADTFRETARRHAARGKHAARIKALGNFAQNALADARYAEAEAACLEALDVAATFGVRQSEPRVRMLHGRTLRLTGRFDEADQTISVGYDRARGAGDRQRLPMLRAEQGLVAHARGDHETASVLLTEALALGEETEQANDTVEIFKYLSGVSEARGDYARALDYYKKHHHAERRLEAAAAARRSEASLWALQMDKTQRERDAAQREAEMLRRHQGELNETNRALRAAGVENDILLEQLRAQTQRLSELADRDPLTHLYNRRFLDRRLGEMLADAQRGADSVAVAVMDLDDFKSINDRFSHETGDFVLRIASYLMRENLRPGDVLARYGGEEFVLVLPGADPDDAQAVCERLRDAVSAYPWQDLHDDLVVTISVGTAQNTETLSAEALLSLADERLYKAKASGKNRIVSENVFNTAYHAPPPPSLAVS